MRKMDKPEQVITEEALSGFSHLGEFCDVINITEDEFMEQFKTLLSFDGMTGLQNSVLQKSLDNSYVFIYFNNYLNNEDHGAKITTIVVEKDYTCLNFLEDYVNYYARCYTPYRKKCKRLHLFRGTPFDLDNFKKMLLDPEREEWKDYQGCIVVKPIPKGVFGVTYLNHYDSIHGKNEYDINPIPKKGLHDRRLRYYKCLTDQTVNIFGIKKIIKTMPFKEQDGIVASCATTAMWMAFHKTAEIFKTKAPSLSEITLLAGDNEYSPGRIFPSRGLLVSQVCKAINNLGMVAEIKTDFHTLSYFKMYLHAYLQGDIPVLFGFNMIGNGNGESRHMVTMNGYRYDSEKYGDYQNLYISDTIEKFYAHDDQIGPFTRIEVKNAKNHPHKDGTSETKFDAEGKRKGNEHLRVVTAWWLNDDKALESMAYKDNFKKDSSNYRQAVADYLIVPLSSTIKVSFDDIYDKMLMIQAVSSYYIGMSFFSKQRDQENEDVQDEMREVRSSEGYSEINKRTGFTWNILITKNNNYKSWLHSYFENFNQKELLSKVDVLMLSLPKYIWVVQAYEGDNLLFDFIFDTVENNMYGLPICVNIYRKGVEEVIKCWNNEKLTYSFSAESNEYNKSLLKELNEKIKINGKHLMNWEQIINNINNRMEEEREKFKEDDIGELSTYATIMLQELKTSIEKMPIDEEIEDIFDPIPNDHKMTKPQKLKTYTKVSD
jgi:hypothetical protein